MIMAEYGGSDEHGGLDIVGRALGVHGLLKLQGSLTNTIKGYRWRYGGLPTLVVVMEA
jgi:hypothetical protein